MTNSLTTDIYYRGYRLSSTSEGGTHVWAGEDLVDTFDTAEAARSTIDDWMEAW